jgi:lipopolysaccharide biosynthesis regulator YciM
VRAGAHAEALSLWGVLIVTHPASFNLVARDYAKAAIAASEPTAALDQLLELYRRAPTMDLLSAIGLLDVDTAQQQERVRAHLRNHPTLAAAQAFLSQVDADSPALAACAPVRDAVTRAAQPLHRYRCAACAFEAQHYFWQCPGCLSWDSYPPQRLEDL